LIIVPHFRKGTLRPRGVGLHAASRTLNLAVAKYELVNVELSCVFEQTYMGEPSGNGNRTISLAVEVSLDKQATDSTCQRRK
jgi:hypothetical protein